MVEYSSSSRELWKWINTMSPWQEAYTNEQATRAEKKNNKKPESNLLDIRAPAVDTR